MWHEFAPDEVADYVSESDRYYRTPNHIFIKNQKHRAHFQSTESSYVKNINFDKYIKFGFLVTDKKMGWFVCDNGYPLENKPYLIFKGGEVHSPAHSIYVHERISGLEKSRILYNQALLSIMQCEVQIGQGVQLITRNCQLKCWLITFGYTSYKILS